MSSSSSSSYSHRPVSRYGGSNSGSRSTNRHQPHGGVVRGGPRSAGGGSTRINPRSAGGRSTMNHSFLSNLQDVTYDSIRNTGDALATIGGPTSTGAPAMSRLELRHPIVPKLKNGPAPPMQRPKPAQPQLPYSQMAEPPANSSTSTTMSSPSRPIPKRRRTDSHNNTNTATDSNNHKNTNHQECINLADDEDEDENDSTPTPTARRPRPSPCNKSTPSSTVSSSTSSASEPERESSSSTTSLSQSQSRPSSSSSSSLSRRTNLETTASPSDAAVAAAHSSSSTKSSVVSHPNHHPYQTPARASPPDPPAEARLSPGEPKSRRETDDPTAVQVGSQQSPIQSTNVCHDNEKDKNENNNNNNPPDDEGDECMIVENPTPLLSDQPSSSSGSNSQTQRRRTRSMQQQQQQQEKEEQERQSGEMARRFAEDCDDQVYDPFMAMTTAASRQPLSSFSLTKQNNPANQRQPRATDTAQTSTSFVASPVKMISNMTKSATAAIRSAVQPFFSSSQPAEQQRINRRKHFGSQPPSRKKASNSITPGASLGLGLSKVNSNNTVRKTADPDYQDEPNKSKKRTLPKGGGVEPCSLSITRKSPRLLQQEQQTTNRQVAATRTIPTKKQPQRDHQRRRATPEIVEIDDDSDHDDENGHTNDKPTAGDDQPPPLMTKYGAVRISIGTTVLQLGCNVIWHAHGDLSLEFRQRQIGAGRTRRQKASGTAEQDHTIDFDLVHHVTALYYYNCGGGGNGADDTNDKNNNSNNNDGVDFFSFLAMQTTGPLTVQLQEYCPDYQPDDSEAASTSVSFVVVEFREDSDLQTLVQDMQSLSSLPSRPVELSPEEARECAHVLWQHSQQEAADRQRRWSSASSSTSSGKNNKDDQDNTFLPVENSDGVVLVYPFGGEEQQIDDCAKTLNELHVDRSNSRRRQQEEPQDEAQQQQQDEALPVKKPSETRDHFLTVHSSDLLRLEPEQYLNDTLIDFWMKWISRGDASNNTHFFSTHFYTKLAGQGGVTGVQNWTQRKGIDIFGKKLVFFPINKTFHWSLAVAVNPGAVRTVDNGDGNNDVTAPHSCILFFDSLRAHSKNIVAKNIRKWLNAEWKRIKHVDEEPFRAETMKVHAPKIPYQENGWDCGVFVCRYAYAVYNLRNETFSYSECHEGPKNAPPFRQLITENDWFRFDGSDIDRIRREIRTLICKLSHVYHEWETKRKEEKRQQKKNSKMKEEENKDKGLSASSSSLEACGDKEGTAALTKTSELGTLVPGDGAAKENTEPNPYVAEARDPKNDCSIPDSQLPDQLDLLDIPEIPVAASEHPEIPTTSAAAETGNDPAKEDATKHSQSMVTSHGAVNKSIPDSPLQDHLAFLDRPEESNNENQQSLLSPDTGTAPFGLLGAVEKGIRQDAFADDDYLSDLVPRLRITKQNNPDPPARTLQSVDREPRPSGSNASKSPEIDLVSDGEEETTTTKRKTENKETSNQQPSVGEISSPAQPKSTPTNESQLDSGGSTGKGRRRRRSPDANGCRREKEKSTIYYGQHEFEC